MIQVHDMFFVVEFGWDMVPLSPVKRMTLSSPGVVHAEIIKENSCNLQTLAMKTPENIFISWTKIARPFCIMISSGDDSLFFHLIL